MEIGENIVRVREQIAEAALRAGRRVEDVRLMAVSKTFPANCIREAYDAGQRLFGENRVQEFETKRGGLTALPDAEFHMIGHLQGNKANKAVELFSAVDSVDSLALAERLNTAAAKRGRLLPIEIELNLGDEESKTGLSPHSRELNAILEAAPRLLHLEIRGLMAVPPYSEDPENARPYFRRLREVRDEISDRNLPCVSMVELSMGMSHDFAVAIEEGSTCVRLGTAIFGARNKLKQFEADSA